MFKHTTIFTKSMFSRKPKRKSDRTNNCNDTENSTCSGSSSNTSITSNSYIANSDNVHGKKSKMFTITGDHSPLWTTLTHAQTITEFVES